MKKYIHKQYPNNIVLMLTASETEEQLKEVCGIDLISHSELNERIFDMVISSILTPLERTVVHAKYKDHLSQEDISDELCLCTWTLESIVHKSLRKIPYKMKEFEDILSALDDSDVYQAISHYINEDNPKANKILDDLYKTSLDVLTLIISNKFVRKLLNSDVDTVLCGIDADDYSTIRIMINAHTLNTLLLSSDIYCLDISPRAYNALGRYAGIRTVNDLLNLSKDDLLKIRNIGESTATHIVQCVEKAGLTLREDS